MADGFVDPGTWTPQDQKPNQSRKSQARRPRGVMKVGGQGCSFIRFTVENKGHFAADTFIVELEPWQQIEEFGFQFWADADPGVTVEFLAGMLDQKSDPDAHPTNQTSLIFGMVDDIEIDPNTGRLLLTGRDLTSLLIDRKVSNKWPDHTASWIVKQLLQQVADEIGIRLSGRITETNQAVGQYYSNSYVAIRKEVVMWDLITFLAQQEGFDAYFKGTELYFGPPESDDDPSPYTISCQRDNDTGVITSTVKDLKLHRSLTLANDITVTVLSHGSKKGKTIKAVASRAGVRSGGSSRTSGGRHISVLPSRTNSQAGADSTLRTLSGASQNYRISRPNLTQEQAQSLAQKMLDDLSKWERTAEVEDVGDPTISIRRKARITGTGTGFDTEYHIFHCRHQISIEGGYGVWIGMKNHPVESSPVLS